MEKFLVPLGKIRYHDDIRPALCVIISDDGVVKTKLYFIISNFFLTGFSAQLWQHIKNGNINFYNDVRYGDYTENFYTKEDLKDLEIGLGKIDYHMCYVTNNRTIANFGTVISDNEIPYEGDFTELKDFDTENLKIIFDYIYNNKYDEYLTYINNLLLRTRDTIIYSSDIRNFKFRFIHRLNHFKYIFSIYLKPHDVLKDYLEEIFECLKKELIYISNGKITVDRIEFNLIFDLIKKEKQFENLRELTTIMQPIHRDKKSPKKVDFLTNFKSFISHNNAHYGGKKSRKRNSKKFKKRKTKRKSKKSKKRKSTKRRRHTKRRR